MRIVTDLAPACVVGPRTFRSCDHVDLLESVYAELGHSPQARVVLRGDAVGWTPFGDALAARPSIIPAGTAAEPDDPALVVYTSGTTGHHLAQEMNPLDDGFRQRTSAVFDTWRLAYTNALDRAKDDALVHPGIDTGDTALALVAQIEGTLSLARNSQDPDTLTVGSRSLRRYLDSMRGT